MAHDDRQEVQAPTPEKYPSGQEERQELFGAKSRV